MENNKLFTNKATIISSLIFIVIIITIFCYENFIEHRNTVVKQQQEHLLTIAKSISRSLDTYLKNKADILFILSQNTGIIESVNNKNQKELSQYNGAVNDFYERFQGEIEGVKFLDKEGNLVYQYPHDNKPKEWLVDPLLINVIKNSKQKMITKEYRSGPQEFSVDILQPVFMGDEFNGVLVGTINLNKLYDRLIHPIRPGKKGYGMIKNKEGIILMHPVKSQIGIDSIKVRKERFPEFNWEELEGLFQRQLAGGDGYHIYHSKWWQDNEMKWTKKINAYTTLNIEDVSWIISVQMDYAEIDQPIRGTLINISLIAVIIIFFILMVVFIVFKIDRKQRALEIETRYLKDLNKTYQELIKSEERLRHSQKLQTIGTLTSGIAHEFNNLLTPILGYSELLLKEVREKSSMYEDIWEINKCALRAKEIIEQILVFSRNDSLGPKATSLRVECLIKDSIRLIKAILPSNTQIVEDIRSDKFIYGIQTQLQQVLLNIYSNACHAMKGKGGVLEITAESVNISNNNIDGLELKEGDYVRIRVKDNGIGIDKETLSQIFDPFFTTKEAGEGTGLGLSVVHGIIKSHKGSIRVASEISIGTTVDIYLPTIEEEIEEEPQENPVLYGEGNILIVDDNIEVLNVFKRGLERYGYSVWVEADGQRAIKLFDDHPETFSTIIVDYTMPNIGGLEIAKHIKLKNPSIRIILVSGYINDSITLESSNEIDAFMLKPIVIPQLIYKIKQLGVR